MNGIQWSLLILPVIAKTVLACFLLLFQFYFLNSKYRNVVITLTSYRRKSQNTKKSLCLMQGGKKPQKTKSEVSLCVSLVIKILEV